jgi:hypothetical protein
MIANIIGHLRLCYQLLRLWVLVLFGREITQVAGHSRERAVIPAKEPVIPAKEPVIPAKAGIQPVDSAMPKVWWVDSRPSASSGQAFRGNDCGPERPCLANDGNPLKSSRGFCKSELALDL